MPTVTLRYFAWVRERVGTDSETVELPGEVSTPDALISWLKTRGDEYAHAFADDAAIRVAIDQVHAGRDQEIAGASEIAFFPPMTGG
ncbi:MAG: molybdopterin converting factor subunit 1 [Pseudomonadota bacterium]